MKRITAVTILLLGLVLMGPRGLRAQSGDLLNLSYSSFSNVSGITMNGTTVQADAALRLTPAQTSSAGSGFYSERTFDLTQPLHTVFSFYLHDSNTPVPADGITFTLQSNGPNALGAAGGGLGYAGIGPSVAVQFATFASPSNPTGAQIGIDVGGQPPVATAPSPFPLYGTPAYAWVDYDPSTKLLQVFVSRANAKPTTPLLTKTVDLAATVGSSAWAGFTGGTGADDEINDITSWNLTATATPMGPPTSEKPPAGSPPATPAPTSASSRALIIPNKTLSVTGPSSVAGGALSAYTVNVTSSVACFALDEPIDLYTLGNPNASALSPLFPPSIPPQDKNHYRFTVEPGTKSARFSLEVDKAALDATGLGVKAVWPFEAIERVVTLVAPAEATPTPIPASVPATVAPTATSTATATPGAAGPAAPSTPTATPTATPVPTGPFFLRTCITPNPVPAGSSATIYGQTTPGAVCTARVRFSNGKSPTDLDGGPQTALSDGFVVFPFTASTTAGAGRATVQCSLNGTTETSITNFLILQTNGMTNPAAGTLGVSASVNPSIVMRGQQATLTAVTTPGAVCVATLVFLPTAGITFNGYAQTVPGNGTISWTFTANTPYTGQATAYVSCALGTATGDSSATFTVT